MNQLISIEEAASLLGVSKETLRNWDKLGKLQSIRNPANNYRMYDGDVVFQMGRKIKGMKSEVQRSVLTSATTDPRGIVMKLQRCIRDSTSNSSLISRFDEITKLIYVKSCSERSGDKELSFHLANLHGEKFANKIRHAYKSCITKFDLHLDEYYSTILLPDDCLLACAEILSPIDHSANLHARAYEEIISATFDSNDNQQFFTPYAVGSFIAEIMEYRLCGRICDPACGTGSLLIEAVALAKDKVTSVSAFEIDRRLAWAASINLDLHNVNKFSCKVLSGSGTLSNQLSNEFGTYDCIITNPPFGSDLSDKMSLDQLTLGRGLSSRRRGVLFIERCLDLLREGGHLAIIIDEGVLSQATNKDVREHIAQRSEIEAIIALPESTFQPYASVKTSIFVLKKKNSNSGCNTFFARAEKVGRKPNGEPDIGYTDDGEEILNSDLPDIAHHWRIFQEKGKVDTIDERVFLARLPETLSKDGIRLDFQFHHPSRILAQKLLERSKYPVMQLASICDERNEAVIPSLAFPDQQIHYTGLAQMVPYTGGVTQIRVFGRSLKSSVRRYEQGEVLFAKMRPNLEKCAYMNFQDGGYASAECMVLKPKNGRNGKPLVDALYLATLMRSKFVMGQLLHKVVGIGRPRLTAKDIRAVMIPVPPLEIQRALLDAYQQEVNKAIDLRKQAEVMSNQSEHLQLQAVENLVGGLF